VVTNPRKPVTSTAPLKKHKNLMSNVLLVRKVSGLELDVTGMHHMLFTCASLCNIIALVFHSVVCLVALLVSTPSALKRFLAKGHKIYCGLVRGPH
jgi:hypothetical protein